MGREDKVFCEVYETFVKVGKEAIECEAYELDETKLDERERQEIAREVEEVKQEAMQKAQVEEEQGKKQAGEGAGEGEGDVSVEGEDGKEKKELFGGKQGQGKRGKTVFRFTRDEVARLLGIRTREVMEFGLTSLPMICEAYYRGRRAGAIEWLKAMHWPKKRKPRKGGSYYKTSFARKKKKKELKARREKRKREAKEKALEKKKKNKAKAFRFVLDKLNKAIFDESFDESDNSTSNDRDKS